MNAWITATSPVQAIPRPHIEEVQESRVAERLGWVRRGRVPCLDGIRAISILLVIMDHSRETIRPALLKSFSWLFGGHFGVTCFFVISGFLISLLLFREFDRNQSISLRGFYARRALRLLPAYIAYLLFALIVTHVTAQTISLSYWTAALTYTMCYMPRLNSFWNIGHVWSLAVEEHFYLFWPILIAYLRPRRAAVLAGIYVALSPAIRFLVWQQHRDWLDIDFSSITQMSSIATGCVLGFVVFNHDQQLIRILKGHIAVALALFGFIALIASAVFNPTSGKYYIIFGDPGHDACPWPHGILGIWFNPNGLLHRCLNTRAIVAVGILSYSIYLWQQPFTGPSAAMNWAGRWPQNLLFIFAAATASYFIVERPFLKLRKCVFQHRTTIPRICEDLTDVHASPGNH